MELKNQDYGHTCVVSITGSIDALTSTEVQGNFQKLYNQGKYNLVADLAQVDFMSSAGLRVLIAARKETLQHGGDIRLAAARSEVERMLNISGFTNILKTYADVEAAVAGFE